MSGFLINASLDNENQKGSKFGHIATSISETFWGRLNRYGRPKSVISQTPVSVTSTSSYTTLISLAPSIGNILYPRAITIGLSQPGIALAVIQTNIDLMNNPPNTNDPTYRMVRLAANTPYVFLFEGEYFVHETGFVSIKVMPDTACNAWASIDGFEVIPDA